MIQCQLKLILRPTQERLLSRWLWHLTGVYNWALRKIELDARNQVHHSAYGLMALLNGHSNRIGIPTTVLRGTVSTAHMAWTRCFRKLASPPKRKGRRNRLNSIPIANGDMVRFVGARVQVAGLGRLRFHRQRVPDGQMGTARIVKRASGWYLCLFIHAEPNAIPHAADGEVGIDPGFTSLLALSTGEKIHEARELIDGAERLAQAQRGRRKRLASRLHERMANQRKDRNHKLSRRLVAENKLIVWSSDNTPAIAKTFGKRVLAAGHSQLRQMLAYKCRTGDRQYVEVHSRNSTRACSTCGALTGPRGRGSLKVRTWACGCGAMHDRDVNAAINTLKSGLGANLNSIRKGALGIASYVRRRSPRRSQRFQIDAGAGARPDQEIGR